MARKVRKEKDGQAERVPLTVRPLRKNDWPTILKLFGDRGACGGCWCMWWRVPRGGKLWHECKGERNRQAFRELVEAGRVHAVLALAGKEPVGWCCFGPRQTFPHLERVKALKREFDKKTWSIVCFYIHAKWRNCGVAGQLLQVATSRAFALGALEIEGYPVVPSAATGKMPAAFAYTGVPKLFERAGYEPLPRPGVSRPLFVARAED
jgi:GNAT superfamily N-acetyltransferase